MEEDPCPRSYSGTGGAKVKSGSFLQASADSLSTHLLEETAGRPLGTIQSGLIPPPLSLRPRTSPLRIGEGA